ncbi:unnamed protein product [Lota lota]
MRRSELRWAETWCRSAEQQSGGGAGRGEKSGANNPYFWGALAPRLGPAIPTSGAPGSHIWGHRSSHLGPLVLTSGAPGPHAWGHCSPCLGFLVPTSGDPRFQRLGPPCPHLWGHQSPGLGACGPHVWGPLVPKSGAHGPHVSGRCLERAALSGGGLGMTSGSLIKWIWFLRGNSSLCSPGASRILASI